MRTLTVAIVALVPHLVWAQQITPEQATRTADMAKKLDQPGTLAGAAAFGMIGEDFYLSLQLRLSFDFETWGFGVGVPIRLRLYDRPPEDSTYGAFRTQDWDEVSDYFRIIRYVYIGSKEGPFYLRLGELSGLTLGHGTIVNRFYNGFDLDRFRLGLDAHVRVGPYTTELVIGDMARPKDTVMVGWRGTIRPLQLGEYHSSPALNPEGTEGEEKELDNDSIASRLVVGLSIITDPTAPRALLCSPANLDSSAPCVGVKTEDEHPLARNDEVLGMIGVDVAYELLRGPLLSITPYLDINNLLNVENGWGMHLGVMWGLHIPLLIDTLTFELRTEYRRVSGDYVGPYFDSTYAVERYESPQGSGLTKLQSLRTPVRLADGTTFDPRQAPGKNGLFFDLLAGFPEYIFIGGEYIDYDGGVADGTLRLSVQIPALSFIQLNAFYLRTRIDGTNDFFKLDDRSAVVAEAAVPIGQFLQLQARWWRLWRAGLDGNYESVDDWSVGIGFSLAL